MKKFNVVLLITAVAIIIAELVIIAQSNLSWSKILGPMLTITGMILLIISMVYNIRNEKKQKE